ncbi:hypothetical protein AB0E63_11870 [Kribbella sp. NPDC026596]|uniref:hypothetical protein n=1 Tax=Kribbella sp. NPDC026596 TaxID=3155122 RepID=UPI0033EF898A
MNPTQPNPQLSEPTASEGESRKISRAARRRVHAREYRVRRTQKAARSQLPTW